MSLWGEMSRKLNTLRAWPAKGNGEATVMNNRRSKGNLPNVATAREEQSGRLVHAQSADNTGRSRWMSEGRVAKDHRYRKTRGTSVKVTSEMGKRRVGGRIA